MCGRRLGLYVTCVDQPLTNPDLTKYLTTSQVVTFESEFFKPQELTRLLNDKPLFPSLKNLGLLQDRLTQKQSLQQSKLKTSPFWLVENREDLRQLFKKEKALVGKKRLGGYDGYGTFVLRRPSDVESFLEDHGEQLSEFIFEKWIQFKRELALQVARSRSGDIRFFPLVETLQKDNKCFLVTGPLKTPLKWQKDIGLWLNKINYVGVMGLEFFETKSGLLVNEIAPRVHNTGHHTLDSCTVDQFTMHWLCALQDKLPIVELKAPQFAMLNLIGKSHEPVVFPKSLDGQLYWYQKSNRPGRKLGHINWVGKNKRALINKALQHLKKWNL